MPAGATLESRYRNLFSSLTPTTEDVEFAGGTNDVLNIAVVDNTGAWTGVKGSVLETFEGLSKQPMPRSSAVRATSSRMS